MASLRKIYDGNGKIIPKEPPYVPQAIDSLFSLHDLETDIFGVFISGRRAEDRMMISGIKQLLELLKQIDPKHQYEFLTLVIQQSSTQLHNDFRQDSKATLLDPRRLYPFPASTMCVGIIVNNILYCGNLGDSSIHFVTQDEKDGLHFERVNPLDNVRHLLESGELTTPEIVEYDRISAKYYISDGRVNGHAISKQLGGYHLDLSTEATVTAKPITRRTLIINTSDGFFERHSIKKIKKYFKQYLKEHDLDFDTLTSSDLHNLLRWICQKVKTVNLAVQQEHNPQNQTDLYQADDVTCIGMLYDPKKNPRNAIFGVFDGNMGHQMAEFARFNFYPSLLFCTYTLIQKYLENPDSTLAEAKQLIAKTHSDDNSIYIRLSYIPYDIIIKPALTIGFGIAAYVASGVGAVFVTAGALYVTGLVDKLEKKLAPKKDTSFPSSQMWKKKIVTPPKTPDVKYRTFKLG